MKLVYFGSIMCSSTTVQQYMLKTKHIKDHVMRKEAPKILLGINPLYHETYIQI